MRSSWIVVGLMGAGLVLAGGVQALPADKHLTLEADDGESCTSDQKIDCFRVTNGSLDGFVQGMRVHVMLENVGDNPHNVYVTTSDQADDNNVDTPADAAINDSDTIDPGQSTNLTFTVPEDASGLYLWCEVGGHETLGMWLESSVEEAPEAGNGTGETDGGDDSNMSDGDSDGEDDGNMIPAPGLAIVGLAAAIGAATRRRRPS